MATFGSITVPSDFSQMTGTATNDAASSGNIGEWAESNVLSSAPVGLTTATPANMTSIASLPAGDWEVGVNLGLKYTTATQSGDAVLSINTVSAAHDANTYAQAYDNTRHTTTTSTKSIFIMARVSLASPTTVYAVVTANFSAGTCGAFGKMRARRVR